MDDPTNDNRPGDPPRPDAARRGLFGIGAIVLLLTACGGGGGGDYGSPPPPSPPPPPPPPPPPGPSCSATAIAGNHGHALLIPAADLDSMTNKTYDITGAADHAHTITLTPAQLQQIRANNAVLVNSSVDVGHFHEVTVNCS